MLTQLDKKMLRHGLTKTVAGGVMVSLNSRTGALTFHYNFARFTRRYDAHEREREFYGLGTEGHRDSLTRSWSGQDSRFV